MKHWLFLVALVQVGPVGAEISFVHLDVEDGLSHNSVYAITQDNEGFVWFGTADGLNRYDGYEFRTYRQGPPDLGGLSNNSVSALFTDREGGLWAGTEYGINRYLPEDDGFRQYLPGAMADDDGFGRITALHQDDAGVIRAGTEAGVLRFDPEADRFRRDAIAGPMISIVGIQQAPDGALWILGRQAGGERAARRVARDGSSRTWPLGSAWDSSATFLIDGEYRIWTHYRDHGRFRDGTLQAPTVRPDRPMTSAYQLRDGQLWFGTPAGLYFRAPDGSQSGHQLVDPADRSWLRNYVRAIFEDRSGSVWVGTYTGVYRYDPGARPFRSLGHEPDDASTLGGSAVSSVTGDGRHVWVGTFGGGITRIDRQSHAIAHFRHDPGNPTSLPNDVVWHLFLEDGVLWIGTDAGLSWMDTATGEITGVPGISGSGAPRVTFILRGLDGALWISTGGGLRRLPAAGSGIARYPVVAFGNGAMNGTSDDGLGVLWQQDADTIWIGTDSGHLNRLDLRDDRFRHYALVGAGGERFEGEGVWDILPDGAGGLWLGHGAGLHHFDTRTGEQRHVGIRQGLAGSVVYALAMDREGYLWLGTNRGLSRFDPRSGRVRNYTKRDGLANMEFNRHADWKDDEGRLYFGGISGLTWFLPSEIRPNDYAPPVVLTQLGRYGASGIEEVNPRGLDRLVLGPHDYGFSARFAALSYVSPAQNLYAFRLLGLEDRWLTSADSRLARYTNLAPGEYLFQVRGSNNDGLWSERLLELPVIVVPAFWETRWFRLLVILAVVALLWAGYRLRANQWRRMEQMRLRIASDLHDDVSSDLSGIAVATDMVRRRPALGDADRRLLDEVAQTARRTGSALRDVVWYINPEQDSIAALADRVRSVSNSLLAEHDRDFDFALSQPDRRLPMETRRHLLLIFKEAVHNIVRHAGAVRVRVGLWQEDRRIRMTVEDDGRGFEPGTAAAGHGLDSMRRRARAIGARLDIERPVTGGIRVVVNLGIPDSRDGADGESGLGSGT